MVRFVRILSDFDKNKGCLGSELTSLSSEVEDASSSSEQSNSELVICPGILPASLFYLQWGKESLLS